MCKITCEINFQPRRSMPNPQSNLYDTANCDYEPPAHFQPNSQGRNPLCICTLYGGVGNYTFKTKVNYHWYFMVLICIIHAQRIGPQNFGNPYDCPEGMYGGSMMSGAGYSKVQLQSIICHMLSPSNALHIILGRRLLWPASPAAGRACLQSKRRHASQCTSRGHRGRTAPSSTARPLRASVAPAELPRRHRYCHLQARRRKPGSLRRTTFRFVGNCACASMPFFFSVGSLLDTCEMDSIALGR